MEKYPHGEDLKKLNSIDLNKYFEDLSEEEKQIVKKFRAKGYIKYIYDSLVTVKAKLVNYLRVSKDFDAKNLEGISQKVLTDSLRSMEEDGLITRTVYPEVPPHVEYALSDLGETMRPILDDMKKWGTWYKENF